MSKHIKEFVITKKGAEYLKRVAAGVRLIVAAGIMALAVSVNAQPIGSLPDGVAPCQFYSEWKEKLEWSERQHKENRIQFFWVRQNKEGQTGLCNQLKGNPDSCERVSWVARINSKRPDVYGGWTFPDRVQVVYHFEGGVEPANFCIRDVGF